MSNNETVEKGSNVIIAIMFVAIFLVVMLLALVLIVNAVSQANTNLNGLTYTSGSVVNESHFMNGTIGYFDLDNSGLYGVTCTIPTNGIVNRTDGVVIAHGNWTQQNCRVSNATSTFNNVYWNVTYTYQYDTTNATVTSTTLTSIQTGVLGMVANFFSLAPVIGTIFAVIILIAGIVILVVYVRRMKDQGNGSSEMGYTG